jgi:hypothetical protein
MDRIPLVLRMALLGALVALRTVGAQDDNKLDLKVILKLQLTADQPNPGHSEKLTKAAAKEAAHRAHDGRGRAGNGDVSPGSGIAGRLGEVGDKIGAMDAGTNPPPSGSGAGPSASSAPAAKAGIAESRASFTVTAAPAEKSSVVAPHAKAANVAIAVEKFDDESPDDYTARAHAFELKAREQIAAVLASLNRPGVTITAAERDSLLAKKPVTKTLPITFFEYKGNLTITITNAGLVLDGKIGG